MIHLSGQNYNAKETIQNIFSPLIGVVTSPQADEICHRNNLSFVELLQPFARLQNNAQFNDAMGTSVSIKGLRLNFCDVNWRPPQTVLARKMLNESVTNVSNVTNKTFKIHDVTLEFPSVEPWFEQWREIFLTVQFPADHEFTRHFLSCLIVLSSGDPNVMETAQILSQRVHQMQNVTPQKLPKWFHTTVLNSYVILHEENQDDISRAQHTFELLKSTFGDSKCFLLQLNSLNDKMPNEIPDYWASFIKRHPKSNDNAGNIVGSNDQLNFNRTSYDASGMSSLTLPSIHISELSDRHNESNELGMQHPLSPIQERATEALNSKFSVSSESISSQNINTQLWSYDVDMAERHGQCLNAVDVENIRHFIQDYAVRALVPYVEHLVTILNEAITSKKGVSKSLLSATKRWFVTSKPGVNSSSQNTVIYTQESVELQTRKLGDLYFMFCHYNMAFQAYHQAKRDFNADSAWQYYAGALEMAALSAFMLGTANRKTYDYMEDAISCYLNVCKLQQFATRATLLSVECLKTARLHEEAAKQLLRMTSEESDLRSALLAEQAAICFLSVVPTAMYRKYAFQMVLAGNRYSRAGQRKHAYRCYSQSYQVFRQRGWSLAEDHIQYTMAKQACMLKKLDEATTSFALLLKPNSLQNSQQQHIFLKEYLLTQNECPQRNLDTGLLPLAIPQILQESLRILTLIPDPPPVVNASCIPASNMDINSSTSEERIWQRIEEMLVTTASPNRPFIFKPLRNLFTKETPIIETPLAIQGEPIVVAVVVINPIGCAIQLNNIDLIWRLKLENNEELSNLCLYDKTDSDNSSKTAVKAAVKTIYPQDIVLDEKGEHMLRFKLIPKLTGSLSVMGLVAQISSVAEPSIALLGYLKFEAQFLQSSKKQSHQLLLQEILNVQVIPSLPSLSVSFSVIPKNLLSGEIIPITITLRNEGCKAIESIYLSTNDARWLTLQDKKPYIPFSLLDSIKSLPNEKFVKDKEIRGQHVFRLLKPKTPNYLKLQAQESTNVSAWLQAPYTKGQYTLRLMIYYSMPGDDTNSAQLKYRLIRHIWKFQIDQCLTVEACCNINNYVTGELSLNIDARHSQQEKSSTIKTTEVYINSLALSCDNFALNASTFYVLNKMNLCNGTLGDDCLKPSKSVTFHCGLKKKSTEKSHKGQCELAQKLSFVNVTPCLNGYNVPELHTWHSFLVNQYTIYFNSNISIEEFNKITANYESFTILTVNWSAVMESEGSQQRIVNGQHFIQMKYIYQKCSCPPRDILDNNLERQYEICQFASKNFNIKDILNVLKQPAESLDARLGSNKNADEFWEYDPNYTYLGQRCLLEDDSFLLNIKM